MLPALVMSVLLPPLTLPVAIEKPMPPRLKPTRPPAAEPVASETLTSPLAPEKNVPLIELPPVPLIVPVGALTPTSPPTNENAPPFTFPVANESVIVPVLLPASPPTLFVCVALVEFPTATPTAVLALVIVPSFLPTSPPAVMPLKSPTLIVPLVTVTVEIVPVF